MRRMMNIKGALSPPASPNKKQQPQQPQQKQPESGKYNNNDNYTTTTNSTNTTSNNSAMSTIGRRNSASGAVGTVSGDVVSSTDTDGGQAQQQRRRPWQFTKKNSINKNNNSNTGSSNSLGIGYVNSSVGSIHANPKEYEYSTNTTTSTVGNRKPPPAAAATIQVPFEYPYSPHGDELITESTDIHDYNKERIDMIQSVHPPTLSRYEAVDSTKADTAATTSSIRQSKNKNTPPPQQQQPKTRSSSTSYTGMLQQEPVTSSSVLRVHQNSSTTEDDDDFEGDLDYDDIHNTANSILSTTPKGSISMMSTTSKGSYQPPPPMSQLLSYASSTANQSTFSDSFVMSSYNYSSPAKVPRNSISSNQHSYLSNSFMSMSNASLLTPVPQMKRRTSSGGLSKYQSTPIIKHYEISNQILSAFETNYSNQLYVSAYIVGLQFLETALLEIPKHGYYKSSRHSCERLQSTLDATHVAHTLIELVSKAMNIASTSSSIPGTATSTNHDPESYQAVAMIGDIQRIQQLYETSTQLMEEASTDQEKEENHKQQKQQQQQIMGTMKPSSTTTTPPNAVNDTTCGSIVCDYIHEGTETIASICVNPNPTTGSASAVAPVASTRTTSGSSSKKSHLTSSVNSTKSIESTSSSSVFIPPPPLLVKASTSSSASFNEQLARALFLSGLDVHNSINGNNGVDMNPPNQHSQASTLPTAIESPSDASTSYLSTFSASNNASIMNQLQFSTAVLALDDSSNNYSDSGGGNDNHSTNVQVPPVQPDHLERQKQPSQQSLSMVQFQILANIYHDDFFALLLHQRVQIRLVKTYQGKNPKSTNGCAVIAPLLCIHHMLSNSGSSTSSTNHHYHSSNTGSSGSGSSSGSDFLSDNEIIQVIDVEAPIILSNIRSQLGLSDNAYLIPSDVHDYLLEQGTLNQNQFLSVTGGNVLDDDHLNYFISILENAHNNNNKGDGGNPKQQQRPADDADESKYNEYEEQQQQQQRPKRIAATFFFHEHVVSILKVRRRSSSKQQRLNRHGNQNNSHSSNATTAKDQYCYEFIDSLPYRAALRRDDETDEEMFMRLKIEPDEYIDVVHVPHGSTTANVQQHQHPSYPVFQSARLESGLSDFLSCGESEKEEHEERKYNYNESNASTTATGGAASSSRRKEYVASVGRTNGGIIQDDQPNYQQPILLNEVVLTHTNVDNNNNNNTSDDDDQFETIPDHLINGDYCYEDGNAMIVPRTTRIRCINADALKGVIRWYACSAFTNENITYINQYKWDDSTCDFDPRVFQAFVWSS